MTSTIKVDNIQKVSDGSSIIKKCGSTITVGSCGATVALASGASQTGFGTPSSSVLWCTTAKTSPFTAADKVGYFVNTSGGVVTVTLPASPSAGDVVAFKDYGSTWDTNSVTVCRNGSKINGNCSNAVLFTKAQSATLIYVDGTKGWQDIQDSTSNVSGATFIAATGGTVLTNGDFKTHIFTASGCFAVSSVGNPAGSDKVEYLVVAGGGPSGDAGAGSAYAAGGGGAGGFRYASPTLGSPNPLNASSIPVTAATFPISIGAGGSFPGTGSNSVFSTITSSGGGGGARDNASSPAVIGNSGGSGGGGTGGPGDQPGGAGNTPSVSPPQGQPGGIGKSSGNTSGGGGGGASQAGEEASTPGEAPQTGGDGGDGSFIPDTFVGPTAPSYGTPGPVGSSRFFAGGGAGGGGYSSGSGCGGTGGAGGGGPGGGPAPAPSGTAGTANTGGGGGGSKGSTTTELNGGSGIVMIRYKFQ